MRIKNKIRMLAIFPIILALVVAGTLFIAASRIETAQGQRRAAQGMVQDVFELDILAHRYLYLSGLGGERPKQQWLSRYTALAGQLEDMIVRSVEHQGILDQMRADHEQIGRNFGELVNVLEKLEKATGDDARFLEDQSQNHVRQLLSKSESFRSRVSTLAASSQAAARETQGTANLVVLILVVATVILLVVVSGPIARSITGPIARLHDAAEVIGAGNLDHPIAMDTEDEIGELSRAFDRMTRDLRELNETLEQRVADRTAEAEQRADELARSMGELERTNEKLKMARTASLNMMQDIDGARQRAEHAEAEIKQAAEDLERSNKELDDFAYIASHDLKEPLRGINNYAAFMIEDHGDNLDEEGREKLETMRRLCGRMEDLINTLLTYSRVGRLDLAIEPTDLNVVVHDIIDSVHVRLEEENVDVRIPKPLPTITCDRARIGEVFRNLVTNAMKYNDKDERWIEIGHGPYNGTDEAVDGDAYYVRDNGIGIREKHMDSVFRIFKRLHGRDKYGGGTGAGLTIVKKIVERHGGHIWVESEYGKGTTFYFTILNAHAPSGDS